MGACSTTTSMKSKSVIVPNNQQPVDNDKSKSTGGPVGNTTNNAKQNNNTAPSPNDDKKEEVNGEKTPSNAAKGDEAINRNLRKENDTKNRISNMTKYDDVLKYYTHKNALGSGAFGLVRKATCNKTGIDVAIKTIWKTQFEDKFNYIKQEVEILLACDHENIIKCYDVFEDDNTVNFVLDLIEGGDLYDYIMNSPGHRISEAQCKELFVQMVDAVHYLHVAQDIVHRDIKPENFLMKQQGNQLKIVLIDFGFALKCKEGDYLYDRVGSLQYMAPELLIDDSKHDRCVDYWALGVVLFNMLTGKQPFSKKNGEEALMQNIVDVKINFDSSWNNINRNYKELVKGLLEKDLSKRYSGGDIKNLEWLNYQTNLETVKGGGFKPGREQIEEIINLLLLPSVNLKRLIGDILVKLSRETALMIKEHFCKSNEQKDDNINQEFRNNYFAEENIVTYHFFLNELLKITIIPEDTNTEIRDILKIHEQKTHEQKIDYLHFLDKTINSIKYLEKESLKELFMNYDENEEGFIKASDFVVLMESQGKKIPENFSETILKTENLKKKLPRFFLDPKRIFYSNTDEFFELWTISESLFTTERRGNRLFSQSGFSKNGAQANNNKNQKSAFKQNK